MDIGTVVMTKDGKGKVEEIEGMNILIKLDSGVYAKVGMDNVKVVEKDAPAEKPADKKGK